MKRRKDIKTRLQSSDNSYVGLHNIIRFESYFAKYYFKSALQVECFFFFTKTKKLPSGKKIFRYKLLLTMKTFFIY